MMSPIPTTDFYRQVAGRYPRPAAEYYGRHASRLSFEASLLFKPKKAFVDVGSGLNPLALGLQLLGMRTTMVDRFDYPVEAKYVGDHKPLMAVLADAGVRTARVDITRQPLPFGDDFADTISCIACVEHLHSSPRPLLRDIARVLKPGGHLLLGGPNAVNLRKRLSVLIGRSNLPPIEQFWSDGDPTWYGHVREPTMPEMHWMVEACGLTVVAAFGRNFIGEEKYGLTASLLDPALRRIPSLCSDIYVLAEKREATG